MNSQYLIIEDFFPTILEMTGIKNYKTVQKIDGKSFVVNLRNNNLRDSTRALLWHFPNNWKKGSKKAKEYNIVSETEGIGPVVQLEKAIGN